MRIQEHFPLREVGSFQTGGATDWYIKVDTVRDLLSAVGYATEKERSYFVVGEGSQTLFSDSGYPGLVIQNAAHTLFFLHDRSQVIADAGIPVRNLVSQTISSSYSGIEFLSQLQGTLGGALYHNRALFGYEVADYVKSATLLTESGEIATVDREWFQFSPNSSRLKQIRRSGGIVPTLLSVTLQLSRMKHDSCIQRLRYFHDLHKNFPLPTKPRLQVFDCLSSHLLESAHAPVLRSSRAKPHYYLDRSSLYQMKSGDIEVFIDNPNFIVNTKIGTSHDARTVITSLCDLVQKNYGQTVGERIEYAGLWD